MLIFWRLVLGHFIADFTLQTNKVAQWKRVSRWGMLLHVLCHPIMYILICWPYLSWTWIHIHGAALNGWVCVALIVLIHWVEDEWRVWAIRHGTPDTTAFLLWDQAVHFGALLAFSPSLSGTRPELWVIVAIGVVLLAHFTSVLIFFVENDCGQTSKVLAEYKYGYMAERLVLASLLLLPSFWFLAGIAALAGLMAMRLSASAKRSWPHVIITSISVVAIGFTLRHFIII